VRVRYMHSDVDTIERIEIIRDLRLGVFDCLIGINLLREGLDIPECAFVGILDADKEGFLRSETSLIQTIGRAARNSEAKVVLYADTITGSMERAMAETRRRRERQERFNTEHGTKPITVISGVKDVLEGVQSDKTKGLLPRGRDPNKRLRNVVTEDGQEYLTPRAGHNLARVIDELEKDMREAAANLEFEEAARLRDEVKKLRDKEIGLGIEAILPPPD
jgi:excinuclease ABC subunit B